ncbi:hypothetical protein WN51_05068 [Melipona quadrifasciata]|uniref:Histone-lysine N-methyltransferase SETMAR n=1 Tax=Melipona quadrifasciata TaxID=166423 RepID=A0A0M8ZUC6_9HYME|nr:hypothetical protein WN51_05068 [Melipona quadrifasciata]
MLDHTCLWPTQLLQLGWNVLVHPPYLSHLDQFFSQKPQNFYKCGIMELPEKWRKVIE